MQRDLDYVREILLNVEKGDQLNLKDLLSENATKDEHKKLAEHLKLLIEEAGLLSGTPAHMQAYRNWLNIRLTWKGHEYLDNFRDPEIWRKTREASKKVGGFSLDLVSALAKGLIKKQIEKHTGVDIDL